MTALQHALLALGYAAGAAVATDPQVAAGKSWLSAYHADAAHRANFGLS